MTHHNLANKAPFTLVVGLPKQLLLSHNNIMGRVYLRLATIIIYIPGWNELP